MKTIKQNKDKIILFSIYGIYLFLFLYSKNFPFFWDGIAQTSKQGFNFYNHFFGGKSTGVNYSLPLMPLNGLITAFLWKIFGLKLWVYHSFIFVWILLLIHNTYKITKILLPKKHQALATLIVLLETTVLSQFVIAGIDIIIFSSFVMCVRAILGNKKLLLAISFLFLLNIYVRGAFIATIIMVVDYYYNFFAKRGKNIFTFIKPYLLGIALFTIFSLNYLLNGKVVLVTESNYSEHYILPRNFFVIIKHIASFGLRSVENGRFLIWILAIYFIYKMVKNRTKLNQQWQIVLSIMTLHFLLYIVFIFVTQMPFSPRYFFPHYFILTLFTIYSIDIFFKEKIKVALFSMILFLQITGNFWIYPDNISKSWDTTLGHLSYYPLREKCFNYIDQQKINYNELSAGFCFYGDRQMFELTDKSQYVSPDYKEKKYFIYSNISNLEDNFANELKDITKWQPLKRYKENFVEVIIYQRVNN